MNIAGSGEKVRKPVCTMVVLVVTITTFILTKNIGQELYNMGTVKGMAIFEKGELYRLLTGMFLHADIGHIVANMLMFLCLGSILEEEFGTKMLIVLYFLSGIIGNFASASYYFERHDLVTSVGASAGIYGLMGATLVLCVMNHGEFKNVTISKIMMFFMISIVEGILAMNIDIIAHITGLIIGVMIGAVIGYPQLVKRVI